MSGDAAGLTTRRGSMRYGPTDSHRPPHPGRHRDRRAFGAGRLQELGEAGRPEPGELGGDRFGRGQVRSAGFSSGVLCRRSSLGRFLGNRGGVRCCTGLSCAARDSLGDLTGPGAATNPDPDARPRRPTPRPTAHASPSASPSVTTSSSVTTSPVTTSPGPRSGSPKPPVGVTAPVPNPTATAALTGQDSDRQGDRARPRAQPE